MLLFCEGFKPKNVILFLFSIIHFYLLAAKITPDVNNSLLQAVQEI